MMSAVITGRTPRGVRGLKLPTDYTSGSPLCRTPRGVRGLKLPTDYTSGSPLCRTPRGVRGLKLFSAKKI